MKLRVRKIEDVDQFGTVEITASSMDGMLPFAEIVIRDSGLANAAKVGETIDVDFGDLDRTRGNS